ncbi:hypothetical protein FVER53590_25822 [Fusarium verticillioides]|nr:hypothetical protein FVER53590_25822 [Fusarium verticillioides]
MNSSNLHTKPPVEYLATDTVKKSVQNTRKVMICKFLSNNFVKDCSELGHGSENKFKSCGYLGGTGTSRKGYNCIPFNDFTLSR